MNWLWHHLDWFLLAALVVVAAGVVRDFWRMKR